MKRRIWALEIYYPVALRMSAIAAFIFNFAEFVTLKCDDMNGDWKEPALPYLLGINEALVPPPSSITKLVLGDSGHLPSTVLEWFTDLQSGVIKSLSSPQTTNITPNKIQKLHKTLRSVPLRNGAVDF
jgi:hypothetical protein